MALLRFVGVRCVAWCLCTDRARKTFCPRRLQNLGELLRQTRQSVCPRGSPALLTEIALSRSGPPTVLRQVRVHPIGDGVQLETSRAMWCETPWSLRLSQRRSEPLSRALSIRSRMRRVLRVGKKDFGERWLSNELADARSVIGVSPQSRHHVTRSRVVMSQRSVCLPPSFETQKLRESFHDFRFSGVRRQ